MVRPSLSLLALFASLFLALAGHPSAGQENKAAGKKRADRVQVKASAGKCHEDGSQILSITLSIDDGWYIIAHPVGLEDCKYAELTVSALTKVQAEKVSIDYPVGKEVEDRIIGNWRKYEGKVVIPMTVKRTKGDREPLTVKVRYFPLNDKTCGVIETKTITVPSSGLTE